MKRSILSRKVYEDLLHYTARIDIVRKLHLLIAVGYNVTLGVVRAAAARSELVNRASPKLVLYPDVIEQYFFLMTECTKFDCKHCHQKKTLLGSLCRRLSPGDGEIGAMQFVHFFS
jgi:hypothetical protein